jgi:hypothetical protein
MLIETVQEIRCGITLAIPCNKIDGLQFVDNLNAQ